MLSSIERVQLETSLNVERSLMMRVICEVKRVFEEPEMQRPLGFR